MTKFVQSTFGTFDWADTPLILLTFRKHFSTLFVVTDYVIECIVSCIT